MLRKSVITASVVVQLGCPSEPAEAPGPERGDSPAAAASAREVPTPAGEQPGDEAAPGVRADGEIVSAVDWFHGTLDAALEQAKAQDKRVLVDVGAYWCPPCHQLDEELFVLPDIGRFVSERFVAVHVDAEKDEGPELVDRYRVQAYPTLLVLDSTGVERGRIVDFVDAAKFTAAVERIDAGGDVFETLSSAVEAASGDAKLEARYALGHAHALAARREQAEVEFEQVLAGDPDDRLGLASRVLYDRAGFFVAKLDADPEAAIAAYRTLQARYPKSKSARRAYRRIGRQLAKQGKRDEAIASLDAMLALDPADTGLRSSYGWFCFRQGVHPARGLKVVTDGFAAAPEDADLRYLAAELSAALGKHDEAVEHIRKASELEPKRPYYRRSVVRLESQRDELG
jgi:tetratricopeptide (TPR) repeat protein